MQGGFLSSALATNTLTLQSYTTIDLYSNGSTAASAKSLNLQASGLRVFTGAGGTLALSAADILLSNPNGATSLPPPALSAGTLAMANSGKGVKGKGTNGSQFFLVYADTQLGPDYTIFGRITSGLDLLKKIAEVGAYKVQSDGQAYYAGDGFPIQLVVIESASAR
jgi:cyclophilin family peptidyl-prolyl cis-trans isomerase